MRIAIAVLYLLRTSGTEKSPRIVPHTDPPSPSAGEEDDEGEEPVRKLFIFF